MFSLRIENVTHRKGKTTEAFHAIVHCGEKAVRVVYNCLEKNLLIHRWYSLTKEERDAVRAYAKDYFSSRVASQPFT